MVKRRAVLIGVSEYESNAFDNLPVVRRDLEILHTALEKSDYSVRTIGAEDSDQTGRTKILKALRKECREAKGVEVLLLYFSGHGIHYEGRDYLIPSDADFEDLDFEEYLITPDAINQAVDQSDAKTILFVIDACRQGVRLGTKDLRLVDWSRGQLRKASHRSYVLTFACSSGEFSHYVTREEDSFSLFTKAFADALDREHPSTTISEVLKATQQSLDHLVQTHQKKRQKIRIAFEVDVESSTLARVICDGVSTEEEETESDLNVWSYAALNSSLWPEGTDKEGTSTYQLKQQVSKIVATCWQRWKAAQKAFPNDAWRDEELPVRATERLDLLITRSNPPIELSSAEIALVLTVPFLREAVLSDGLIKASDCEPLSLDEDLPKQGFRFALDKIYQGQPRFRRKAERLQEQGLSDEKDAVMTWLLHRCLLRNLEVWQSEEQGGYISEELIASLEEAKTQRQRLVKSVFTKERLLELARCMFADVERIDRDDRPGALTVEEIVRSDGYRDEQPIREKLLAYLLKLAGLLAIDIRTLSDVIADHIGLSDPLTPQESVETIRQADWVPAGEGRKLVVNCQHPAVDLAFIDHVKDANSTLTHIFRQVVAKATGIECCAGLPTRLLPDGIKPLFAQGTPAYQTPHVNFQLAHDEVRELLMGEQLYGDPSLAIREMYQNALDACRYKEARLEYLKKTNQHEESNDDWEGEIIFRQDVDDQGREYIECEDNGIGMGMQHLSQCFAKAGKRFADLPEFIEEQAEWSKYSIELYPNSQFGVGVLSYFMLSDEIEVETCRLDRKGYPSKIVQVRIPGSSGLFRVRNLQYGYASGTRIRLYLNKNEYEGEPISCIKTLKDLVWLTDYKLLVKDRYKEEIWLPHTLKLGKSFSSRILTTESDVLWWLSANLESSHYNVIDKNGVEVRCLADGIVAENPGEMYTANSDAIAILNLTGKKRPKLTVDRNAILSLDKEDVYKSLLQETSSLKTWDFLNLTFLARLECVFPKLAKKLDKFIFNNIDELELANNYQNASLKIKTGFISKDLRILTLIGNFKLYQNQTLPIEVKGTDIIKAKLNLSKYAVCRLHSWSLQGLINISPSAEKLLPYIEDIILAPQVRLGDSVVLELFKDRYITKFRFISLVIFAAKELDEEIHEVYSRLKRLSFFLEKPNALLNEIRSSEDLKKITISSIDLFFFSEHLDGDIPIQSNHSYALISRSLLLCQKFRMPISELAFHLEKFRYLGFSLLENFDHFSSFSNHINTVDACLASENFDQETPLQEDEIFATQILSAIINKSIPLSQLIESTSKLRILGIKIPNISETNIDKLEDNIDAFLNVIGLENPEMLSSIRFNYITLEEVNATSSSVI
ncbi:MAG: hypothetical protein F6K11_12620 [Leptolyngbya sp. SIO3F4]|nr:hypothetical protein [Leptolyngbya sp. SIO3F4]